MLKSYDQISIIRIFYTLFFIVLAIVFYFRFKLMSGDVYSAFDMNERWLSGQLPYYDFYEPSPPLTFLLFTPVVLLSHFFQLSYLFCNFVYLLFLLVSIVSLTYDIGKSYFCKSTYSLATQLSFFIILFAILPNEQLLQRDYVAALFCVPYLMSLVITCEGNTQKINSRILAAIFAGLCVCTKPNLAFMLIFPNLWMIYKLGFRNAILRIENFIILGVGLAFISMILIYFPQYFQSEFGLPFLNEVYVKTMRNQNSFLYSKFTEFAQSLFFIMLLIIYLSKRIHENNLVIIGTLASIGGLASYLIQNKGFSYHAFPYIVFCLITMFYAIRPLIDDLGLLFAQKKKIFFKKESLKGFLCIIMLVTTMSMCLYLFFQDRIEKIKLPNIASSVSRFGSKPTFMFLGPYFIPMIHIYHGITVGHFSSQYVIYFSAVNKLTHPDDSAVIERSNYYMNRAKKIVIDDLRDQKPDILVVGFQNAQKDDSETDPSGWLEYFSQSEEFRALMTHYEFKQKSNTLSIYARKID